MRLTSNGVYRLHRKLNNAFSGYSGLKYEYEAPLWDQRVTDSEQKDQ